MASYSMVCPFLTDDPAYIAGVEFGMIFSRLRRLPRSFRDYIHAANQEQVLLLANRLGYAVVKMRRWDKTWIRVVLRRGHPG